MLLGGSLRDIQVTSTQVREIAQAMSEWMDKVPKQLASICFDVQGQIQRVVEEVETDLKTQLVAVMDRRWHSLEVQMKARYNEVHKEIASIL